MVDKDNEILNNMVLLINCVIEFSYFLPYPFKRENKLLLTLGIQNFPNEVWQLLLQGRFLKLEPENDRCFLPVYVSQVLVLLCGLIVYLFGSVPLYFSCLIMYLDIIHNLQTSLLQNYPKKKKKFSLMVARSQIITKSMNFPSVPFILK